MRAYEVPVRAFGGDWSEGTIARDALGGHLPIMGGLWQGGWLARVASSQQSMVHGRLAQGERGAEQLPRADVRIGRGEGGSDSGALSSRSARHFTAEKRFAESNSHLSSMLHVVGCMLLA